MYLVTSSLLYVVRDISRLASAVRSYAIQVQTGKVVA
jgi:hypothetical protein